MSIYLFLASNQRQIASITITTQKAKSEGHGRRTFNQLRSSCLLIKLRVAQAPTAN